MAVTEKEINELIENLCLKPVEEIYYQSTQPDTTSFTLSSGGTLHPTYGAVPNVTIGSGIVSTTGTCIGPGSPGMWTGSPSYTIGTTTQPTYGGAGKIKVLGDDADIELNGKSLRAWMERVEERLNILTPNPDMEKEWDDLRRLGERYRKLEKKCKEKADMWKKLKSMPQPDVK